MFFNARNQDRSLFKGSSLGRKFLKAMHRKRSRIANMGDCSQWTSKGPRSRGDSCSFKHDVSKGNREKKKIPFSVRNENKDTRTQTEKEISLAKKKDSKVPVRQEIQIHRSALIPEVAIPKGIRLFSPTRKVTIQIQKWMQMEGQSR